MLQIIRCSWLLLALTGSVALAQPDVLSPSEGGGVLDRSGLLKPADRKELNNRFMVRNMNVISKELTADPGALTTAYDRIWASGLYISPLDFLATYKALQLRAKNAPLQMETALVQSFSALMVALPEDIQKRSAEVSDKVSTLLILTRDPVRSLQSGTITKSEAKREIQSAKQELKAAGLR